MTMLTVEINEEQDLPALQDVLSRMGLKYHIEDEWGGLSDIEIEGIKAGLADVEAGRTHTHEFVMAEMNKRIADFRKANDL